MTYTPSKPHLVESSEELRARIPGWGADLDPADRPAVPRERLEVPAEETALPAQQPETFPRERSLEHLRLTPVFGTSCPPKGVSGAIRRHAYARYSEARAAHWLLLLAADRVDTAGSVARSFLTLRPDNPITETGVLSEVRRHGFRSRFGQNRADVKHLWLDPVVVGGPWVLAGVGAYRLGRLGRRVVVRARRHG